MSSMSGSSQSEREMTVNCDYGLRAKRFTSWTEANPGRRFDTCTKVILIMFHVKLMWLLCVFGWKGIIWTLFVDTWLMFLLGVVWCRGLPTYKEVDRWAADSKNGFWDATNSCKGEEALVLFSCVLDAGCCFDDEREIGLLTISKIYNIQNQSICNQSNQNIPYPLLSKISIQL